MSMSSSKDRNKCEFQVTEPVVIQELVLKPCRICGRTFNPQSLERHESVCEKSKKIIRRNVFNSFSQRAKELGAAIPAINDVKEEEKKKCKRWKDDHDNLLRNIKGEKKESNVLNNGLSDQKKVPSGYQQCPSCSRCFNPKAADRHILWCREQQTRMPKTPPNSEAIERLKARIKYRAPLPKPKINMDLNTRLVKSADSVRESTALRTHSSPPIPVRDLKSLKQNSENTNAHMQRLQKKVDKSQSSGTSNNSSSHNPGLYSNTETQSKKAVKFKEIFPVYKKERNKNLDMLAALRLRLSELGTSEDLLDDCFMKPNENELRKNHPKLFNLPSSNCTSRDIWTSDGEAHCSTGSSSDGSLPSLSHDGCPEQRMPRFCYNCGTKYPVVSAKFCCECGARRFVFGANNNPLFAT